MKTVVVIQGPTYPDVVPVIKKSWEDIPLIFSTWEDNSIDCYEDRDIVLKNKIPDLAGPGNFTCQRISSLNGFLKAKELGYDRVIKMRSDMTVQDPYGFLNLCKKDYINFYAFVDHREGYLADFFMEGNIDEMIDLFTIDKMPSFPEQGFTDRCYELGLDKKCNFIFDKLSRDGVDIYFSKRGYWMSSNIGQSVWKDYVFQR